MLYYWRKDKTYKKDLCSVWRRCCDWLNVSKWFAKFPAEDFLLDDAPWSGRSVEVDCDETEKLIENNQCAFLWKNTYGLFGQPNITNYSTKVYVKTWCNSFLENYSTLIDNSNTEIIKLSESQHIFTKWFSGKGV